MSRAAEFDAEFSALFNQELPPLAHTEHHIVGDEHLPRMRARQRS